MDQQGIFGNMIFFFAESLGYRSLKPEAFAHIEEK